MVTESDAAVVGDIDPAALAAYKEGKGARLSGYTGPGAVVPAASVSDTALGLAAKGVCVCVFFWFMPAASVSDTLRCFVILSFNVCIYIYICILTNNECTLTSASTPLQ